MDDVAAAAVLLRQHGLITRAQALDLGLTRHQIRHRVATGIWVKAERGVYRHHLRPADWKNRLLAVCLATGGVASHRSAARLWELDGSRPCRPELVLPTGRSLRRDHVRFHETQRWERLDRTVRDGIPCTGIERTLIDVAAVVGDRRLRQFVDDAQRRQLTDWVRLTAAFRDLGERGRDGTARFRALLEQYGDEGAVPRSDWSRLVADLLVNAGLPRPTLEHPVTDGTGFRAELDLAYPSHRLGLELDSITWHLNRDAFHRDPVRRNRLTVLGWRILTFTWLEFVDHPQRLIALVRAALQEGPRR